MEFENSIDYLETLDVEELTRLYVLSDSVNGSNEELINIVSISHEFLYGESHIKYLDGAQLRDLNDTIGRLILYKLVDKYEKKIESEKDESALSHSFSKQYNKEFLIELDYITLIHENCYSATIPKESIKYMLEDDNVIALCVNKDYEFTDSGFPTWSSIKPLDSDEITSFCINENKSRYVPYKNTSNSGSYNENSKSKTFVIKDLLLVEWYK